MIVDFLIGMLARWIFSGGGDRREDPESPEPASGVHPPATYGDVVAVDVETTGLDPKRDRIVELALVGLTEEGEIEWEWESLVDPGRPVPQSASRIHGITNRDLKGSPRFCDVADYVVALLADKVLLAHNLRFDASFLHAELSRCGKKVPTGRGLDTLELSRFFDSAARSHKFADVCLRYGVELRGGHRAKQDAVALARLFVAMAECNEDLAAGFDPGTYLIK